MSKLPELIKNARRCKSSFDVMLAAAGSRKASQIPALSKASALLEGSCEQAGRTVSAKAAANVVLNMADKPNGPAMAASVISLLGTTKLPLVLHEALVKLASQAPAKATKAQGGSKAPGTAKRAGSMSAAPSHKKAKKESIQILRRRAVRAVQAHTSKQLFASS